jgi:nitroimidazol reductase NimA-like FMN-containing flavoprotein (pyridoxamine 5'-phosphate oxidase superfamily)
MAEREPVAEQLATPDNPTITPWADIRDSLAEAQTTWLATVRPDGRPHVVPVGALWVDGAYYVTTGQGTVKGHILDHNPRCVISLSSRGFDLVFEGKLLE